jgi:hypothetical protein
MTGEQAYTDATKDRRIFDRYRSTDGLPEQIESIALAVLGEVPIERGSRDYLVIRNALELACQVGMAATGR